MDISQNFEKTFVDVIQKILNESGIKANEFARKAFPDQAKPDNKWLRMRKGFNDGKPQRVTLAEAYCIAKALNHDLATLMWRVQKELELQKELQQPSVAKVKKKVHV